MASWPVKPENPVDLHLIPQQPDDPRPIIDRLRDYVDRGTNAPESLSLYEIRQVSFALSLYLETHETK